MRILVTGATGFIGGRIARQLRRDAHDVVAIVRDPGRAHDLAGIGVEIHRGDILDRESLRNAMRGADALIHSAAWYAIGARDRRFAEPVNVEGTRNVLTVMQEVGISKGVYTSTLGVFSDTRGLIVDERYRYAGSFLSEYERTKWTAHFRVAEPMMRAGLPLVIVQPGIVYGPGDRSLVHETIVQFLSRRLPLVPTETAYCWAHVDDIARAHILALERGTEGESYIIGGPVHTVIEVIQLAEQITGIPGPRLRISPGPLRALASLLEPFGAFLPPSYTAEGIRSTIGVSYTATSAKAKEELGFRPRPLADGLAEVLDYEMARLGMPSNAKARRSSS